MLKYRMITGPLLIALLLGLVAFDNWLDSVTLEGYWRGVFNGKDHFPRGMAIFVFGIFVVAPLGAYELCTMYRAQGIAARTWLTALAASLGVALSYCIPQSTAAVHAIAIVSTGMILVFVASLLTFSQGQNVQGVVAAAGAVMFAMVYLGFMLGFLLAIRRSYDAWWIVGLIMTTKSCDIGAYFTGKAIGRHKLIPWLSPGKTWEGLIGGVALSTAVGAALAALGSGLVPPGQQISVGYAALLGLVFGLVGQFGDLMKSLLKRGAGMKDSSSLLPGLGGVLDVLDSPLMVAPVAFWMLEYAH